MEVLNVSTFCVFRLSTGTRLIEKDVGNELLWVRTAIMEASILTTAEFLNRDIQGEKSCKERP